jgi:hypothetical protein
VKPAKYDRRQVVCPNSSCLGYSSNIAKPGYWVATESNLGRVLGRVNGSMLAVVFLGMEATSAFVRWVDPKDIRACYEKPPRNLLAWITSDTWVSSHADIHKIVAMSEYGTLSESYIATRDDPEKPYNSRPEYVQQFVLKN